MNAHLSEYPTLLADAKRAGVFQLQKTNADDITRAAETSDLAWFRINLHDIHSKDELLAVIGKAMKFPDWYGSNLDALMDCLCDMEWRSAAGYVVLLEGCESLDNKAASDFAAVLTVFAAAADEWRDQETPFWCFIDTPTQGVAHLQVK